MAKEYSDFGKGYPKSTLVVISETESQISGNPEQEFGALSKIIIQEPKRSKLNGLQKMEY